MKPSFFGRLYIQILRLWRRFRFTQKLSILVAVLSILLVGLLIMVYGTMKPYVPLYPSEKKLSSEEITELQTHLNQMGVPYKMQRNAFFVPADQVQKIRTDLMQFGIPRIEVPKQGFEIFDTNTWIKGEKELQILELRALKGQLEKDLAQFENVRSANVILDIAPPRPFGGGLYKTKASVILNMSPGARLTPSELRAITFHIAGAVRGLSPNMIAISDTTGRLYQSIDPEGNTDYVRNAEISLEDNLKAKIDGMLTLVVGHDNFYSSVQVLMGRQKTLEEVKVFSGQVDGIQLGHPVTTSLSEKANFSGLLSSKSSLSSEKVPGAFNPNNYFSAQETKQQNVPVDSLKISSGPGKIENISIAVLLDKKSVLEKLQQAGYTGEQETSLHTLKEDIQNQINTILRGYQAKVVSAVDIVDFDPARLAPKVTIEEKIEPPSPVVKNPYDSLWPLLLGLLTFGSSCLGFLAGLLLRPHRKSVNTVADSRPRMQTSDEVLEILKKRMDSPLRQDLPEQSSNPILKILKETPPHELADFLADQNPLTIAWLFSYLTPERTARILAELPQTTVFEILQHLLTFQNYDASQRRSISKTLSERWGNEFDQEKIRTANFEYFVKRCIECMPSEWKKALSNKMGF